MKIIYASNIKAPILVDDEDFEELSKYKWQLNHNGYAQRSIWKDGKTTSVTMHRQLMLPDKGTDVDHQDGNRINNQRSNLRLATRSENMANMRKIKSLSAHSKHKGVSRLKRAKLKNQWIAYIKLDYKTYYLGYYNTEEEAAHMYNQFAEQIYGEFASLNDIL